jgi:hypothetical protein
LGILIMDKNDELRFKEFLTVFQISLGNGISYSPQHPVFLKSLQELKKKLDTTLLIFQTIKIRIFPQYLMIDELKFENTSLYKNMARSFHTRNIKSIKFDSGVDIEELKFVLSKLLLPPKTILKEGGMRDILRLKGIYHISVANRDFLDILEGTAEDKDVWCYLLRKAIESNNPEEIEAIASSFDRMLRSIDVKQLLEAGEFQKLVEVFLSLLQAMNKEMFEECVKAFYRNLARQPQIPTGIYVSDRFKELLQSLRIEDFADVLLEHLLKSPPNFAILKWYGLLLNPVFHRQIAECLGDKIESRSILQINSEWLERIYNLLGGVQEEGIRQFYAAVIFRCKEIFAKKDIFQFDREAIPQHFRAVLVDLLAEEQDEGGLNLIVESISTALEGISETEKLSFYKRLMEIRKGKKTEAPAVEAALYKLDKFIVGYIERCLLDGHGDTELVQFLSFFGKGNMGGNAYLNKIFVGKDLRPLLLKNFFALYPDDAGLFYQILGTRLSDPEFLSDLIENLDGIPDPVTQKVFRSIFPCPDPHVKIKVLKRMAASSSYDQDFLMSVVGDKGSDIDVRQEALLMMRDPLARKDATEILLSYSGPFGKSEDQLIENIRMVGKLGLKEAAPFLEHLRKDTFLWWNKKVSKEALKVLEQKDNGRH